MCIAVVCIDGEVFPAVHEDAASEVAVVDLVLAVGISCASTDGAEAEAEGFTVEGVDGWEDTQRMSLFLVEWFNWSGLKIRRNRIGFKFDVKFAEIEF